MAAGWRTAMAMRTGQTFTEATAEVMADHAAFQGRLRPRSRTQSVVCGFLVETMSVSRGRSSMSDALRGPMGEDVGARG